MLMIPFRASRFSQDLPAYVYVRHFHQKCQENNYTILAAPLTFSLKLSTARGQGRPFRPCATNPWGYAREHEIVDSRRSQAIYIKLSAVSSPHE